MFQIGLPEIIVIALAVLVLANPKELPAMLRRFGRMAAGLRSMREELRREMRDVDGEIKGPAGSDPGKPDMKKTGKKGGKKGKGRA